MLDLLDSYEDRNTDKPVIKDPFLRLITNRDDIILAGELSNATEKALENPDVWEKVNKDERKVDRKNETSIDVNNPEEGEEISDGELETFFDKMDKDKDQNIGK